jgi:hypothetical protein
MDCLEFEDDEDKAMAQTVIVRLTDDIAMVKLMRPSASLLVE